MKTGNWDPDSFMMECIQCGEMDNLSLQAHRKKQRITGFIMVCPKCQPVVADAGVELLLAKTPNKPEVTSRDSGVTSPSGLAPEKPG